MKKGSASKMTGGSGRVQKPGSRGGKVVGYEKDGDPIYASSLKPKSKAATEKESSKKSLSSAVRKELDEAAAAVAGHRFINSMDLRPNSPYQKQHQAKIAKTEEEANNHAKKINEEFLAKRKIIKDPEPGTDVDMFMPAMSRWSAYAANLKEDDFHPRTVRVKYFSTVKLAGMEIHTVRDLSDGDVKTVPNILLQP